MNIFHKVTLQSLRKNKTRTIVTIIGIILSAAMICAVTTFVTSMRSYLLEHALYTDGDWHGSAENADFDTYHDIVNSAQVSDSTYNQILGYAKIESKNEFKPYVYIIGGEKASFFDMMPIHLISGEYPQNSGEIIVPEHMMLNGGVQYKLGDVVSFDIGDRMLDGFVMTQKNPCYVWDPEAEDDVLNGESIEVRETRTYTVVGVYERPSFEGMTAPGYTAITVSDGDAQSGYSMDVFFKMKRPAEVFDFMEEHRLSGTQNNDLLLFLGVSEYVNITVVMVTLSAIVIGLIMFGSIALIYNAFAISVSERTKQFGLLSSIGATKKQLRRMVFFEALTVSAIGIPIGIGVGVGGIGVTLLLIGDKFTSMVSNYNEPMRVSVSWSSILAAVLVALITVFISAWIPSKRATKVSAVEAIRQNADIKAKNKPVKTSKLTYKLFGLPGVLARKHYKRNKKRYRTTVLSLFMSIVLFVSASAFTGYLTGTVSENAGVNKFELFFVAYDDELKDKAPDDVLTLLTDDEHVTHGAYTSSDHFTGSISTEYITDELMTLLGEQPSAEEGYRMVDGQIMFVNDSEFDALLEKYRLDKSDYYNPDDPLAVTVDTNSVFNIESERYETIDALKGDRCEITRKAMKTFEGYEFSSRMTINDEAFLVYKNPNDSSDIMQIPELEGYIYSTLKSGKTITEKPFYNRYAGSTLYMIYPLSMYEAVTPEEMMPPKMCYSFYLRSDDHAASFENLKKVLLENDLNMTDLSDIAANEESTRNTITVINVFAYGFIVLISLIAAANVFNTISTNISLRRREFAMLKSVGMTQKGFNKMMNFECLLYGSKALLLGIPVSAGITYLIYRSISGGFETTYQLPWGAIGIAVLSVFAVVFSTMLYSMHKIKKENPIDALKNENL